MNSLSWLLYAADALGGLKIIFAAVGGFFAALTVLLVFSLSSLPDNDPARKGAGKEIFGFLIVAVAIGCFAAALPSQRTVYMIAASEMGEKVAATPEAKEMLGDLREVISKQIKKLKDDK